MQRDREMDAVEFLLLNNKMPSASEFKKRRLIWWNCYKKFITTFLPLIKIINQN